MAEEDSSLAAFKSLGLEAFIRADARPTAIYELKDITDGVTSLKSREPFLTNPAFDRFRSTTGGFQDLGDSQYSNFLNSVTSSTAWEAYFAGQKWATFTIGNRWRVASCSDAVEEAPSTEAGNEEVSRNESGVRDLRHPVPNPDGESFKKRRGIDRIPPAKSLDWTRHDVQGLSSYVRFVSNFAWHKTAIGPKELWPPELRHAALSIMNDPEPRLLVWGKDNAVLYNEAGVGLFLAKHPQTLGQPAADALGDIWHELGPVIEKTAHLGHATRVAQIPLSLDRGLPSEETFWNFTMVPILDDEGRPVGAFSSLEDRTTDVVAERRMTSILKMGAYTAEASNLSEIFDQIIEVLGENGDDIPFALLYSVQENKLVAPFTKVLDKILPSDFQFFSTKNCKLHNTVGIDRADEAVKESFKMSEDSPFHDKFREAWLSRQSVDLDCEHGTLPEAYSRAYPGRSGGAVCIRAVIIPIPPLSGQEILGFLVMGLNPRRPYDDEYHLFIKLLNDRLINSAAAIALPVVLRKAQAAAEEAALRHSSLTRQLVIRSREAAESEARFNRMADVAPMGMFLYKNDGSSISQNKKFLEYMSLSEDTNLHRDGNVWKDIICDEDYVEATRQWDLMTEEKRPVTVEYRTKKIWKSYDKASGIAIEGPTWLRATGFPELDSSGNIKTVMGWLIDISLQKWSEGVQAKRLDEALEAKQNANNFIDMTSHEMRNPLSAIVQSADGIINALSEVTDGIHAKEGTLVMSKESVELALDNVTTIQLCASHQKRIVDDILTLSKLDSTLLKIAPDVVKPIELISRAVKMYEAELRNADITTKITIDHDSFSDLDVDEVVLDPSRLLQVLINLLTNAIKFTAGRSKREIEIWLCVSRERPPSDDHGKVVFIKQRAYRPEPVFGDQWGGLPVFLQFSIKDTGKGLTDEEMSSLFHRFSQASPKTYGQYGGSGLGLFISRELTEMQGGQVGVASEAGKGSTFSFYLKAIQRVVDKKKNDKANPSLNQVPNKDLRRPSASIRNESSSEEHLHVLVVEDNLINQKVMSQQLRRAGCTVHVADHGGEALTFLKRTEWYTGSKSENIPLSVVLMDLEMPVMDGLTCIRKVREMQRNGDFLGHLPVIAVTANARNEQIENSLKEGMDLVVTKPFRIPELVPQIRALIGGKRTKNDGTFTSNVESVDSENAQSFEPGVKQRDVDKEDNDGDEADKMDVDRADEGT